MPVPAIHPWNEPVWEQWVGGAQHQHHAVMLNGARGIGKHQLALQFGKRLLCENPDSAYCGQCQSCRLFDAGSHPDFHLLQPETAVDSRESSFRQYALKYLPDFPARNERKLKVVIGVDQIRRLSANLVTHPHLAANKVIVLSPAESMNINAANALLKALEEPSGSTVFLLVNHDASQLPITIRSRCVKLPVPLPDSALSMAWLADQLGDNRGNQRALEYAGNAPLVALEWLRNDTLAAVDSVQKQAAEILGGMAAINDIAQSWRNVGAELAIKLLQISLCRHLLRRYRGKAVTGPLDNTFLELNSRALLCIYDRLATVKKLLEGPVDETLLLEDTLIYIQNMSH